MPIAKFSALEKLIQSLSKAEKRHFIVYSQRYQSNQKALFIRLFNLMDKFPAREENYYYKRLESQNKTQFLNAKRHLYAQLLKSLRIQNEEQDDRLILRQRLDYAEILYKKGLYYESLAILETIKMSGPSTLNLLYLEVTALKKRIESRHITRSRKTKGRIESLVQLSEVYQKNVSIETKMSNLAIEVLGLYIKWGFAKNYREAHMYELYFQNQMPPYEFVESSILATALWHQANVWFHYMNLNFVESYNHAVKWIERMTADEQIIREDPDLYIRGFHYVLTNCFYLQDTSKFESWFDRYKRYRINHQSKFNEVTRLLDFCYYENAVINQMIIANKYPKLALYSKQLENQMLALRDRLDVHRIMIFYFKLSLLYSYKGEYHIAIDYLNKIIDQPEQQLRSDIFSYARLVQLMCHYRINNFNLVVNLLPSVKVTFESNNNMNPIIELMISFLRRGSKAMNFGINDLIQTTYTKLDQLSQDKYNKVALLYYDYASWVASLESGLSVEKLRKGNR